MSDSFYAVQNPAYCSNTATSSFSTCSERPRCLAGQQSLSNRYLLSIPTDEESHPSWITRLDDRYNLEMKKKTPPLSYSRKKTSKEGETPVKNSHPNFKKLMRKCKVESMVNTYCIKMKRGLVRNSPLYVEKRQRQEVYEGKFTQWVSKTQGIVMSNLQSTMLAFLGIIAIVLLSLVYSLAIMFEDSYLMPTIRIIQIFTLFEFVLEIFVRFTVKRYELGQALIYINDIAGRYIRTDFIIDLINLILLSFDLIFHQSVQIRYWRWFIVLKFPQILSKLQVLQNMYITTFYRQKYWGLFQVIITNFTLAHILSISLNAMATLNPEENWLIQKNLINSSSAEKYVWGYYWGTTIMLTVGFGDYAATNSAEALCLIFIEMLSCIILAYNINCVGNIIDKLRIQFQDKNNNLKTFQLMARSNHLDLEIENKVNNYIQESFMLKNQFNFEKQDELLSNLPVTLKKQYLKNINLRILKHLTFVKDLTSGTKILLAEKIKRQITHPDEIIQEQGDIAKFMVLRKGSLGMMIKTSHKAAPVQTLHLKHRQTPKLLNLGFIKQKRLMYTLKSLTYSILNCIQNEDLLSYLKQSPIDYESYCYERDKFSMQLDNEQIYTCSQCRGQFHSKFVCPKLHYTPIRQIVVYKYLKKAYQAKQKRIDMFRMKERRTKVLLEIESIHDELGIIRSFFMSESKLKPLATHYCDSLIQPQAPQQQPERCSLSDLQMSLSKQQFLPIINTRHQTNNYIIQYVDGCSAPFWQVECDQLHNWRHYFPGDNPQQIEFRRRRKKPTLF